MDAKKNVGHTAPVTTRHPCVLVAMLSIVKRLNNLLECRLVIVILF
jgi:hypothetical protein